MLGFSSSPQEALGNALQACRRHFVSSATFSALVNLLFVAPMLYMLQVYDRVVPTQGGTTLLFLSIVLIFALGTLSALDAVRSRILVRSSARLDQVLAETVLQATLLRPEQGAQGVGRQVLREFDKLRQALGGPAILAVFDVPWMPVYLLICFLIHPWIGLLAVAGGVIVLLLAWRTEKSTKEPLTKANEAAGRAYASHELSMSSSDVIRALGMRQAMVNRHLQERESSIALQGEASLASSGLVATSKFIRLALQSLGLGLGALLAIRAEISDGAIFASTFVIGRALAPIDQLVGNWKNIVQARGACRILSEALAQMPANVALTRLPSPIGRLAVEGLTVLDQSRRPLLKQVSFKLEAGETLAIIGPSGAGKSTLVRALAGALVPTAGSIRFDGAEQQNWDSEALAEHVGFMPQELSLFAGSIKDNISRFRMSLNEDRAAVDDAVIEAARKAGAHELILRLPGGYDYQLSLGGRGLSSGQGQRIALARALFRSPKYLILDEPNSNLDADGDQQLIKSLESQKAAGVTVLIVAHRLSVLPIIDKLLVINQGAVELFGPRDEVLRRIGAAGKPRTVATAKAS